MIGFLVVLVALLAGVIIYALLASVSSKSGSKDSGAKVSRPSPNKRPTESAEDEEEPTTVRVFGPRLHRMMGGIEVGDQIPIGGGITVGRGKDAVVKLHDAELSHVHAEFKTERGTVYLTDLGSTNGTFVNSVRLAPNVRTSLNEGDQITIGSTHLVFKNPK